MSLKVVNLGLPKTGTTTLARALRRASLHTLDHRVRKEHATEIAPAGAFVGELLYDGYFATGNPAEHLVGYDAVSEMSVLHHEKSFWPQMDFAIIDGLRAHNPGLKFLATWRDPFAISQSMLAWSNLGTTRLPRADVPGLPKGFGETTSERVRWIEGHYAHLDAIFAGTDCFLRVDITRDDAPNLIGQFLERDLPWWGHLNRNPERDVA